MSRSYGKKVARILVRGGLVCLSIIVTLMVVEAALRLFWRPQLLAWQPNLDITIPIDPDIIPGVAGPAHVRTNSLGIRGEEWSRDRAKEYRILAIGGSTTECIMNDQPNSWPALLQTRLGTLDGRKVWVGNVGHAGFDSRHHVLEMKYMLSQYNPDMVIMLVGANDVGLMLREGMDYDPNFTDDHEKMRALATSDFIQAPVAVMKRQDGVLKVVRNAYLFQILRNLMVQLTQGPPPGLVHDVQLYRRQRERRRQPWLVIHEAPKDLKLGLEAYAHNIREIIRLAREHRVRLVFATQPTLFQHNMTEKMVDRIWAGWVGDPRMNIYWSPDVLSDLMDIHNSLLLEICKREGIECVDLSSQIPKSLDVFFDHCHFTDYGCSLVADELVSSFHNWERRQAEQLTGTTTGAPSPSRK